MDWIEELEDYPHALGKDAKSAFRSAWESFPGANMPHHLLKAWQARHPCIADGWQFVWPPPETSTDAEGKAWPGQAPR